MFLGKSLPPSFLLYLFSTVRGGGQETDICRRMQFGCAESVCRHIALDCLDSHPSGLSLLRFEIKSASHCRHPACMQANTVSVQALFPTLPMLQSSQEGEITGNSLAFSAV